MADRESEIRARLAAATPWPWVQWEAHADVYAGPVTRNTPSNLGGGRGRVATCDFGDDFPPEEEHANASFIAAAPADVEWLLAEVAKLRRVAEAAKAYRESERAADNAALDENDEDSLAQADAEAVEAEHRAALDAALAEVR